MDKLFTNDKNQSKDQTKSQIRNTTFRRHQGPLVLQVMPRGQRNQNEQQTRLSFQGNLINEEFIE